MQESLRQLLAAYRPGVDPISRNEAAIHLRAFNQGVRHAIIVLDLAAPAELDEMLDRIDRRWYADRDSEIRRMLRTGKI